MYSLSQLLGAALGMPMDTGYVAQFHALNAWHLFLIEAYRRRQIDPWEYLRDVLTRLPSMTTRQIEEVMPDAWARARFTTGRSSSSHRHRSARRHAAA